MATYYFRYAGGWIGGSGVVIADNKETALHLANNAIKEELLSNGAQITDDDLIECHKDECVIITNGDC